MKKKYTLIYLFALLINDKNVLAQSSASEFKKSKSYRIGFGLGAEYASIYGHIKNKPLNIDDDYDDANKNFNLDAHHTSRKLQISPGFEFGAHIAQGYYFGAVLSQHFTRVSNSVNLSIGNNFNVEHQLKLKSYTNLFLKFGCQFVSKVMLYGVVGPSLANWEHVSTTSYYKTDTKKSTAYAVSKMNQKTVGVGVGAGIEYSINDKYALNFEYTLSMHKAKHLRYQSTYNQGDAPDGILVYDAKFADVQKSVRLSYSTIGLRFSYFFSL